MKNIDISKMNTDDALMASLRQCGHYLHHNITKDNMKSNAEIFEALTDEEKKNLTDLLQKCLKSWNE